MIKVAVSGLDPHSMYSFLFDFVAVEETRWKYVNGDLIGPRAARPNLRLPVVFISIQTHRTSERIGCDSPFRSPK